MPPPMDATHGLGFVKPSFFSNEKTSIEGIFKPNHGL
jgi:hypothetical protein